MIYREAGLKLWRDMLRFLLLMLFNTLHRYGSGNDPMAMLTDLADGPLDPIHYLDA